jgi:hypothetical protein
VERYAAHPSDIDPVEKASRPKILSGAIRLAGADDTDLMAPADQLGGHIMEVSARRSGIRRIELVEEQEAHGLAFVALFARALQAQRQ